MESIFKQHRNGLTALAAAVVLAACAFGIAGLGSDDAQAETQQADADSGDSIFLAESDDSDSQTDDVYEFCVGREDWCLPVKGSSKDMISNFKISKVNMTTSKAYGSQLVIVDPGKYKDSIAARMHRNNGTGSWMVYKGCDMEYAEQVTAEHKVSVRRGGRTVQRWVQKVSHGDNHFLDAEVYAFAAADMMGVRRLHLEEQWISDNDIQGW